MPGPRSMLRGRRDAEPSTIKGAPHRPWRRAGLHVLGLGWVLAAAAVVMAPALAHGASLGPFDLLSHYGLTSRRGVVVHDALSSDQIDAFIPWTTLAWTQVHHGLLPLWNPYNALGLPLAFNWQSATFSVPMLIGYLFPLHLAYTVGVLVTLVVAGTGVYALGRVLHLGVLGCTMAATVFELSGPFMGWLGWPVAGVMSWAGWLFAATVLVIRGGHRVRAIALCSVVIAAVLYAGQPEIVVLLATALLVYVVVLLGLRAPWLGGSGSIRRPAFDVAVAVVGGAALGGPILLPGSQIASGSIRRAVGFYGALPAHDLIHVLFQGFDGLPVAGSRSFGGLNYVETAAYVGVIAVVLGVLAVAVRRRDHQIVAFGAVAASALVLAFLAPAVSVLSLIGRVQWHRDLVSMAFALAVLAGIGTDVLVRSHAQTTVRRWVAGGFIAAAVMVAALWLIGRGSLHPLQTSIREKSFIWPSVEIVVGLVAIGAVVVVGRRPPRHAAVAQRVHAGRWAAGALLVCETAFLVTAGMPLWSSSPGFIPTTPAVKTLQRSVGASLVGLGKLSCHPFPSIGIVPNANILYEVHQLAAYDPVVPSAYYSAWKAVSGRPAGFPFFKELCPAVTTAALARLYGVQFILEPRGARGPTGAVFDKTLGNEDLYRVPGAAPATLSSLRADGGLPALDAPGTPVAVTHPDPASWTISTDATGARVLRLRLTDVPGWHASIDGRPLALTGFAGVMLQARIPAGRHHIELHYWPDTFNLGLALAGVTVLALAASLVSGARRRRRRTPSASRAEAGRPFGNESPATP